MNSIVILAAWVFALLLHEAGHALALSCFRVPIKTFQIGAPVFYRRGIFSLGLIPLFGSVEGDLTAIPISRQAWFYAAGPIGSIVLGCGALVTGIWLNFYSLKLIGVVNLAFGAFNLIPIPPMDGYKLLTLGRQIPHLIQVAWTVIGWTLIAAGTLWRLR